MATEVVIAYRDLGCPHRRASFQYVLNYYTTLGLRVTVENGDETFTRAKGINTAIRRSSADVIVQSDPDSLVPSAQLHAAVAMAEAQDGVVIPFHRPLYLNPAATTRILAGDPLATVGPVDCEWSGEDVGVGNVVVFSRLTWEVSGGFDERFGMWGGDDAAFAYAASAFTSPLRRIDGDMIHLWHPRLPESMPDSSAYVDQFTIVAEYRDAAAESPAAVRAYVGSRN